MSALPTWIPVLGSSARFQRSSFKDGGFSERDLDELVVAHAELLTDLLVENEIIREGSRLQYIGRQFHAIDVLFVEVDEDGEPLRLVVVEDKLLNNPEAKRRVIGQLVDYAARFQEDVRADVIARRFPEYKEWLEQNADAIDRRIELGEFLLVVCGDGIHANVADIVTRLAHRADRYPLSGMQLCLVAMELYLCGSQRLIVPHLVGRVARAQRRLEIRVAGAQGEPLRARVVQESTSEAAPKAREPRIREFFRDVWIPRFGERAVAEWNEFAAHIAGAQIPGLTLVSTEAGRPTVQLQSRVLDATVPILRARYSGAGFRDVCSSAVWNRSGAAMADRDRFRERLARIPGASVTDRHEVVVPTSALSTETPRVIVALRQLAQDLDCA